MRLACGRPVVPWKSALDREGGPPRGKAEEPWEGTRGCSGFIYPMVGATGLCPSYSLVTGVFWRFWSWTLSVRLDAQGGSGSLVPVSSLRGHG
jgi:hypothetical protein